MKTEKLGGSNRAYHHGDLPAVLLSAAEAELEERGVEAFSLRGVARRIGVSHAASARHYQDVSALLTALARLGFERLVATQRSRQSRAAPDPVAQLTAAGRGYVEFALESPALFRLMFASNRPDHGQAELARAASEAYGNLQSAVLAKLAEKSSRVTEDDALIESTAAWALAHGLAELLNGKRLKLPASISGKKRRAFIQRVLERLYNQS